MKNVLKLGGALLVAVFAVVACGGGDTGGSTTAGNDTPNFCAAASKDDVCQKCYKAKCCTELDACASDDACSTLYTCLQACTTQDCETKCQSATKDDKTFDAINTCLAKDCATECDVMQTCTPPSGADACTTCEAASCCNQALACQADADCSALLTCLGNCASGDTACETTCQNQHTEGAKTLQPLGDCLNADCTTPCGGTAPMCNPPSNPTPCDTCEAQSCCAQAIACQDDADCGAFLTCIGMCASGDMTCETNCEDSHPEGAQTATPFAQCVQASCPTQCGG